MLVCYREEGSPSICSRSAGRLILERTPPRGVEHGSGQCMHPILTLSRLSCFLSPTAIHTEASFYTRLSLPLYTTL